MATAVEPLWEQWTRDTILPPRLLTVGDWGQLLAHRPYTVPAVGGIMQVAAVWGSVVNAAQIVDWMAMKLSDDEGIAIAEYADGTNALYLLALTANVVPTTPFGSVGANWQIISGGSGGTVADGSITTAKLADSAVTSVKIADGTIQTVDIAPGAITSALIATGAVGSTQIADGGIQTVDLAPGCVTTPIIQDGAVTGPKIPASTITSSHLLDGTIQGVDIANGAVGTAQIANGAITNPLIGPKAVDTPQLADGCVTNQQLALDSVTSWNIADGTIQTVDIANRAITEVLLAPNSVGTPELITAAVTTAKIANLAVTDPLIASVSWAKVTGAPTSMAPSGAAGGDLGAVGSTYPNPVIAPGAITTAKIADAPNGVTDAKISSVSWGKLTGVPTGISPVGPASGDLTGTYPGPTIAAGVVTNAKMATNCVQTAQIVDANVTNAKISSCDWSKLTNVPSSMPPSGTAGGSLTASYPNPLIAAAAVMRSMLGSDVTPSLPPIPAPANANQIVSVNAAGSALIYTAQPPANLTPGQVSNPYLAADAVTTDKILNGTILGADIAANTIADGNIIGLSYSKLTGAPTSLPPSGAAGGDLSGSSYPNPTVIPAVASKWAVSGGALTPVDATKAVAVPGINAGAFRWGTTAATARLIHWPTAFLSYWTENAYLNAGATGWIQDSATKASWGVALNADGDNFNVMRAPAGAPGSMANLLTLDAAGNLQVGSTGAPKVNVGNVLSLEGWDGGICSMYVNDASNAGYNFAIGGWQMRCDFASSGTWVWNSRPGNSSTYAQRMAITLNGDIQIGGSNAYKASGTTWANPSDIRIKKNIIPYDAGLKEVLALQPVQFEHNGFADTIDGTVCYGYLADDVAAVMPECVSTTTKKVGEKQEEIELALLDTSNISLAVVNAIKELAGRVAALEGALA